MARVGFLCSLLGCLCCTAATWWLYLPCGSNFSKQCFDGVTRIGRFNTAPASKIPKFCHDPNAWFMSMSNAARQWLCSSMSPCHLAHLKHWLNSFLSLYTTLLIAKFNLQYDVIATISVWWTNKKIYVWSFHLSIFSRFKLLNNFVSIPP